MNVTQEAISEKISSGDTHTGCWCVFIKISDTVGLKLYHSKAMRDDTQALSELGFEAGLAPRCWGSFEMEMPEDFQDMGYGDKPSQWKSQSHAFGFFTEIVDEDEVDSKDVSDLMEKMEKAGFTCRDMGHNNVGYLPNGTLVCYDWDIEHNNPDDEYYEDYVPTY